MKRIVLFTNQWGLFAVFGSICLITEFDSGVRLHALVAVYDCLIKNIVVIYQVGSAKLSIGKKI